MILLLLNGIIAALLLTSALNSKLAGRERGTNTVTRFGRGICENAKYSYITVASLIVTILFIIIGSIANAIYCCLPTALVVVLTYIFRFQYNNDSQRITDTRVMTKGSLEVISETGDAIGKGVGTAAACYMSSGDPNMIKTGAKVGEQAGAAIKTPARNMAMSMSDVETGLVFTQPKERDVVAETVPFELLAKCEQLGIRTAGKTNEQLVSEVLELSPKGLIKEEDGDLSDYEKVVKILG